MTRTWAFRLGAALAAAFVVNLFLTVILQADHDVVLITLLALALVAVGAVTLDALETSTQVTWSTPRTTPPLHGGEDARTTMYRQLVEAHLAARQPDNEVLWQIAVLARQRLRQVHGFCYEDDPVRAAALLGPQLTAWMTPDRRHRYDPTHRHDIRYTPAQLSEALRRIEEM